MIPKKYNRKKLKIQSKPMLVTGILLSLCSLVSILMGLEIQFFDFKLFWGIITGLFGLGLILKSLNFILSAKDIDEAEAENYIIR